MSPQEKFEFYEKVAGEEHKRRTIRPGETSIMLDSGVADIPFRKVLEEMSATHKAAKGWKWFAGVIAVVFVSGGTFAVWNGSLVTDSSLDGRVGPLEQRMDVVEDDLGAVKSGVGNMLLLQERDRKVASAKADVSTYQAERDEQLAEWSAKPSRTRGSKPDIRKNLVDAKKRLKTIIEKPVLLAPVDLATGPSVETSK